MSDENRVAEGSEQRQRYMERDNKRQRSTERQRVAERPDIQTQSYIETKTYRRKMPEIKTERTKHISIGREWLRSEAAAVAGIHRPPQYLHPYDRQTTSFPTNTPTRFLSHLPTYLPACQFVAR